MIEGGTYLRAVTWALNVISTSALLTANPRGLCRASFLKGLVMPLGGAASVEGGVEGTPALSMGEMFLGVAGSDASPAADNKKDPFIVIMNARY